MKKIKNMILLGFILIIGILVLTGCTEVNVESYNNIQKETIKEECEHDWVITSEYSFFTSSYKTISKCSKCGKKVE